MKKRTRYKIKENSEGVFHVFRALDRGENCYYKSSEYILEKGTFWLPINEASSLHEAKQQLLEILSELPADLPIEYFEKTA